MSVGISKDGNYISGSTSSGGGILDLQKCLRFSTIRNFELEIKTQTLD